MYYNALVVDDDKTMADCLADLLRLLGHTAVVAPGPRAALHSLRRRIPDVLFLDVNMPGIDGLEVCRYLRREPAIKDLPIVIISANDEKTHQQAAFEAGANFYIVKPAMIEDVENALQQVMLRKPMVPALGSIAEP
jgi:two-component system alkaline phosphatase synthesis response regulator PhoP